MARELGEAIADSKEMKRLKTIDAALQIDKKAISLIKQYNQLQGEYSSVSKVSMDTEKIDSTKEKLLKKQQQLYDNKVTNEYLEAKAEFDKYMKNINDVLNYAITGEVQSSSGGCGSGGGCSSCSGCK